MSNISLSAQHRSAVTVGKIINVTPWDCSTSWGRYFSACLIYPPSNYFLTLYIWCVCVCDFSPSQFLASPVSVKPGRQLHWTRPSSERHSWAQPPFLSSQGSLTDTNIHIHKDQSQVNPAVDSLTLTGKFMRTVVIFNILRESGYDIWSLIKLTNRLYNSGGQVWITLFTVQWLFPKLHFMSLFSTRFPTFASQQLPHEFFSFALIWSYLCIMRTSVGKMTYIRSVVHLSSAGSSFDTHICSGCFPCPHTCAHIRHSILSKKSQLRGKTDTQFKNQNLPRMTDIIEFVGNLKWL